jgi:hypothetical protein
MVSLTVIPVVTVLSVVVVPADFSVAVSNMD